jgi:hypothetical protein
MPSATFSTGVFKGGFDVSWRAGRVLIVSTSKNSRKLGLSDVEVSLHRAGALAMVESVVPERERINEDEERQGRPETLHSFQSL